MADLYPIDEARTLVMLLLCDKLGVSKSHVLTNHPYPFTDAALAEFENDIKRLRNFEPIQYIVGHTWFAGLKIDVDAGALIPRPETEELMSIIEREISTPKRIIDLCTGSGCIPLALKNIFPEAEVIGVELSDEALRLAKKNSDTLKLNVQWEKRDVLQAPWNLPSADLIVSNPPYVLEREKPDMLPNVLQHEPHMALFVDDEDPAIFYRVILREAFSLLNPGGSLYFEASPRLVETIKGAMRWMGYVNCEIIEDFRGQRRFVKGMKK